MKENKRNILVVMISMIAAMLLFMSCKEDGDYMTCTYPTYNSTSSHTKVRVRCVRG